MMITDVIQSAINLLTKLHNANFYFKAGYKAINNKNPSEPSEAELIFNGNTKKTTATSSNYKSALSLFALAGINLISGVGGFGYGILKAILSYLPLFSIAVSVGEYLRLQHSISSLPSKIADAEELAACQNNATTLTVAGCDEIINNFTQVLNSDGFKSFPLKEQASQRKLIDKKISEYTQLKKAVLEKANAQNEHVKLLKSELEDNKKALPFAKSYILFSVIMTIPGIYYVGVAGSIATFVAQYGKTIFNKALVPAGKAIVNAAKFVLSGVKKLFSKADHSKAPAITLKAEPTVTVANNSVPTYASVRRALQNSLVASALAPTSQARPAPAALAAPARVAPRIARGVVASSLFAVKTSLAAGHSTQSAPTTSPTKRFG